MTRIPQITLNDSHTMPQLGFGVFQVPDNETEAAVAAALEAGYRSIDTATIYGNEAGVGRALAASGLDRSELFITTKLWNSDQGPGLTRPALERSLELLGLDRVDLYLIHWPAPANGHYLGAWAALEQARADSLATSIGVSNFLPSQLAAITALGGTAPAVNQIELHPLFQQRETVAANAGAGIVTEAWSPLAQGAALSQPAVLDAAARLGRTPAQVVLRWHLDRGHVVIPKSVTPARMAQNLDVFGFELTDAETAAIHGIDSPTGRTGPDPAVFNG